MLRRVHLLGLLALCALPGCPGRVSSDASLDADPRDADGDGILDSFEGRSDGVDTDGDGTPDYLDLDSDDDGIDDATEAGAVRGVAPIDTDGDGTPDYRDTDSDGNGVPDVREGALDLDGDGVANASDLDNDGDRVPDVVEIGATPELPVDSDDDGTPDYDDVDSDADTLSDTEESTLDTDGDGAGDRLDLDSDDDGWSDAEEAGDTNVETSGVDSDMDGRADFRDADSDADGLADVLERAHGTSRVDPDTDGDGANDLVETVAETDPLDPTDNPRARGDFVFVVPFEGEPIPTRDSLDFATDLRRGDVYFLMDTTASMDGEIAALVRDVASIIVPGVRAAVPEAELGVGAFEDYPTSGHGSPGDVPYTPVSPITSDDTATVAGVDALELGMGGDRPECTLSAIVSALTGVALDWPEPPFGDVGYDPHPVPPSPPSCAAGRLGYGCFRPDAIPIFVVLTDALFHGDATGSDAYAFPAPTYADAVAALNARHARVVWVDSGDTFSREDGAALATATGSVDDLGAPLVFPITGAGVGLTSAVVDAIEAASAVPLDVTVRFDDDTSDTVDTRTAFVDTIAPDVDGDAMWGCVAYPATDVDGDTFAETFVDLTPGPRICFDVVPRTQTTVPATPEPQLYRATLTVIGDGVTPLDVRDVFFLVPPFVPDPGPPM